MPTWPLDQFPLDEPEEDLPLPLADGQLPTTQKPEETQGVRRTNADDVLDAVAGRKRVQGRDRRHCPVCGGPTKVMRNGIGNETVVRRCRNPECKNEFAVGSARVIIDAPPPPPNPLLQGGPYKGNPDRGGGKPPIDPYEPLNRRLAEVIRRMEDDD